MNDIVKVMPDREERLLEKYTLPGPRYTSYPTAPQFSPDFPLREYYTESAKLRNSADAPFSLYVHIPFCRDICYYCACNKIVTRDPDIASKYLNLLRVEIELQTELHNNKQLVRQLHFGGGTPTYLNQAELTELCHMLASNFCLLEHGQREYSIEIDPRTIDVNSIALLRGLGFNRISLGVQDFDPLVQKSINRIQPYSLVKRLVDRIRFHDFRSLSLDLIYGLPNQNQFTVTNTLGKVLDLRPDRIACYSYAHLPGRFSSQRAIDRFTLPTPKMKLDMQQYISDRLQAEDYIHIGMDHYVLKDDDLALAQAEGYLQRNFQGYSVQMAPHLLGLGVSAISQVGDFYIQNEHTLDNYGNRLDKYELPIARGYRMSEEDKLRRYVIMELICNMHLDKIDCELLFFIDFDQYFAKELIQLEEMETDGLLQISQDHIGITKVGRAFVRNICMVFDKYLLSKPPDQNDPKFSATI